MVAKKVVSYINHSDFPINSMAFTAGASVLTLFVCGYHQLLSNVPFHHYPFLFLAAMLVISGFEFLKPKTTSYKFVSNTLLASLGLTVAINFLTYFPKFTPFYMSSKGYLLSEFIFFSTIVLTKLTLWSVDYLVQFTTGELKNPDIQKEIFYSKNCGYFFSALFTLLMFTSGNHWLGMFSAILPSFLAAGSLYYVNEVKQDIEESFDNVYNIEDQFHNETQFNKSNFPFLYLIVSLFFCALTLTHIHQFIFYIGLYEYKAAKAIQPVYLLTIIPMIQSAIAMAVYAFYTEFLEKKVTWRTYFKNHYMQSFMMLPILIFKLSPFTLVLSSATNSVISKSFESHALSHFLRSTPGFIRHKVSQLLFVYVSSASAVFTTLLFHFTISGQLSMKLLWGFATALAAFGFFTRKELQLVFNDYHVGQISRSDIYDSVEYTKLLYTAEAKNQKEPLLAILAQRPKPLLAKAIVRTLGEIKNADVVEPLITYYKNEERNDIKLEVIRALRHYESHHIDLFLLEELESIVTSNQFKSEIMIEFYHEITERIEGVAIPMILRVLKERHDQDRVISNAILVVGELAQTLEDHSLFYLLSQYMDEKYSRRIRCNAALYLYNTEYKDLANSCINSLSISNHEHDRGAVAFFAGEMQLSNLTPFILENSIEQDHKNPTLLIGLLKLGFDEAYIHLSDLLADGDESIVKAALNQTRMINSTSLRHSIYFYFIKEHPEKVSRLLSFMSESAKNFDDDRITLRKEAQRLGVYLNKDYQLFEESESFKKIA